MLNIETSKQAFSLWSFPIMQHIYNLKIKLRIPIQFLRNLIEFVFNVLHLLSTLSLCPISLIQDFLLLQPNYLLMLKFILASSLNLILLFQVYHNPNIVKLLDDNNQKIQMESLD